MSKFTFSSKTNTTTDAAEASTESTSAVAVVTPNTSLAPSRPAAPMAVGGLVGDFGDADIKLPRLNIVQGVGDLSADFKPGSIVYNGEVALIPAGDPKEWTSPLNLTVISARKDFIQNTDYDSDERADVVGSLEEVEQRGGTIEWLNDQPPSWLPRLTMLVLIEAPEGNEAFAERCSLVAPNGKPCELALWTVRKSAYTRAGKAVMTAARYNLRNKETNEPELHHGKWTLQVRREKLGQYQVYVPLLKQNGRHDKEYVDFAAQLM